MLDEDVWLVLRLWRTLRASGAFPDPGGPLDQSLWVIEAFDAVTAAEGAVRDDIERQRKKSR